MAILERQGASGARVAPSEPVVIITGATGALGRATASALALRGEAHQPLDRQASGEGLEEALAAIPVPQRGRAVLIHLAGLSDARAAEREPRRATEEIVQLTLRTVDACARFGLAKCVLVSSALVYGPQVRQPVAEDAGFNPQGVYAAAKAAAELVARGRVAGDGMALEVVRPGNVIGPGIKPGTLVGDLLTQLRRSPERILVQSLQPKRDYVDARDVADALVAVARVPAAPGQVRAFNVGTGVGTSVLELYRLLADVMGVEPGDPVEQRAEARGAFDLVLDAGRLRAAAGWAPRRSLRETLREVVQDG